MTIEQFQKIFELSPDMDSLDYKIKAISVITGKDIDEVEDLSIEDFKALAETIKPPDVSNLSDKLIYITKVKGIKFRAVMNIKAECSTAEFIEVSAFTKDEKTIIKNLHKLLAVFYRPQSKWFGLKKVTMKRSEVAELFLKNMDIAVAYPLAVFFLRSLKNFTPVILSYLEKEMKKTEKMLMKMKSQA